MKTSRFASFCAALLVLSAAPLFSQETAPGRFRDVSEEKGLGGIGGQYVVWCDFDEDGDQDLLVNASRPFRNSGPPDYRFSDASAETGLEKVAGFGIFVDFDNDGDFDLATTGGQLWRNDGRGRFEEISKSAGFAPPERCSAMAWFDADLDGCLDVYFTVSEDWNNGNPRYFEHKMMRKNPQGGFEDATAALPVAGRAAYGRSVSACDYDLDGDSDLYVGNYRLQANYFMRNRGRGLFDEIGRGNSTSGKERFLKDEASGRASGPYFGHTIGSAWADFDNDGLFDLFVANLVHKYVGPAQQSGKDIRGLICDDSKIYFNRGGPDFAFEDRRTAMGLPLMPAGDRSVYKGDELWCNVVCGDFDNDGWVDAYVPQIYDLPYAYALLLRNEGGKTFRDVGGPSGVRVINTYGAAWADFDDDGFLDLCAMGQDEANPQDSKEKKFKGRLHLFRNPASGGRWVRFDLRAASGNRAAVGAQVLVKTAAGFVARQVEIGTGSHGQQNDMRLHFGLGESQIKYALVRWGGGLAQLVRPSPAPGETRVLVEPPRPLFELTGVKVAVRPGLSAEIEAAGEGLEGKAFLWDLDGDGSFDKATWTPGTSAVFAAAGQRFIRVLALDPESAVGLEACCLAEVY